MCACKGRQEKIRKLGEKLYMLCFLNHSFELQKFWIIYLITQNNGGFKGEQQTWQLREIGWKEPPEMHLRAKQKNVMTAVWKLFCWEWRGKLCDEYEERSIMMWTAEGNIWKGMGHYKHLNIHQLSEYNRLNKLLLASRPGVIYNSHLFA